MNEFWGRGAFLGSLVFMNLCSSRMFAQGMAACCDAWRWRRQLFHAAVTGEDVLVGAYSVCRPALFLVAPHSDGTGPAAPVAVDHRDILYAAVGLGSRRFHSSFNFFWSIPSRQEVTSDNPGKQPRWNGSRRCLP